MRLQQTEGKTAEHADGIAALMQVKVSLLYKVQIFDFQYNTQSIGMKISYVQFDAGIAGNGNTFEEVNI